MTSTDLVARRIEEGSEIEAQIRQGRYRAVGEGWHRAELGREFCVTQVRGKGFIGVWLDLPIPHAFFSKTGRVGFEIIPSILTKRDGL